MYIKDVIQETIITIQEHHGIKAEDDNSPIPNCYEKVNEGLLSAMDVLYALTLNATLVNSNCACN